MGRPATAMPNAAPWPTDVRMIGKPSAMFAPENSFQTPVAGSIPDPDRRTGGKPPVMGIRDHRVILPRPQLDKQRIPAPGPPHPSAAARATYPLAQAHPTARRAKTHAILVLRYEVSLENLQPFHKCGTSVHLRVVEEASLLCRVSPGNAYRTNP